MKVRQLFLILLLVCLAIPFVNASIEPKSVGSGSYNLGDKVLIEGTVTNSQDIRASLNLFLNCDSGSVQVATIVLNLKANRAEGFSNLVTLSTGISGNCNLVANLVSLDDAIIESKSLGSIKVTNDLKANFDINKKEFQLGDSLIIKGSVLKQSNIVVDGVLVLSFKQDGKVVFMDTADIVQGAVNYNKILNKIMPGKYTIDVLAKDNLGNSAVLDGLFEVMINGDLNINTALDKTLYSPGDTLNLNGYVTSPLNNQLKNINVDFDFGDVARNSKLANGAETFAISYIIPGKIKSGSHNISITAYDEDGNYAIKNIDFTVQAIPTALTIGVDSSNYNPEQEVKFSLSLLDQAGDVMNENIRVDLIDNKGNDIASKIVKTGTSDTFLLAKAALPGSWKLSASGLGLNSEASFNVREYKKLDASVKDTNLVVENVGNVQYKGPFDIKGNDLTKTQDLKLDVGSKKEIKLGDLFSPGNYNLTIPTLEKFFDTVSIPEKKSIFDGLGAITGNAIGNAGGSGRSILLFLSLIVLCCGVGYLLLIVKRNKKSNKIDYSTDKDYLLGQKKLDELRAKGIRKDPPRREKYGKATKEDVEDWKRRVQESFREHERMKSENEFVKYQQKNSSSDKPKGGLFNMFN